MAPVQLATPLVSVCVPNNTTNRVAPDELTTYEVESFAVSTGEDVGRSLWDPPAVLFVTEIVAKPFENAVADPGNTAVLSVAPAIARLTEPENPGIGLK